MQIFTFTIKNQWKECFDIIRQQAMTSRRLYQSMKIMSIVDTTNYCENSEYVKLIRMLSENVTSIAIDHGLTGFIRNVELISSSFFEFLLSLFKSLKFLKIRNFKVEMQSTTIIEGRLKDLVLDTLDVGYNVNVHVFESLLKSGLQAENINIDVNATGDVTNACEFIGNQKVTKSLSVISQEDRMINTGNTSCFFRRLNEKKIVFKNLKCLILSLSQMRSQNNLSLRNRNNDFTDFNDFLELQSNSLAELELKVSHISESTIITILTKLQIIRLKMACSTLPYDNSENLNAKMTLDDLIISIGSKNFPLAFDYLQKLFTVREKFTIDVHDETSIIHQTLRTIRQSLSNPNSNDQSIMYILNKSELSLISNRLELTRTSRKNFVGPTFDSMRISTDSDKEFYKSLLNSKVQAKHIYLDYNYYNTDIDDLCKFLANQKDIQCLTFKVIDRSYNVFICSLRIFQQLNELKSVFTKLKSLKFSFEEEFSYSSDCHDIVHFSKFLELHADSLLDLEITLCHIPESLTKVLIKNLQLQKLKIVCQKLERFKVRSAEEEHQITSCLFALFSNGMPPRIKPRLKNVSLKMLDMNVGKENSDVVLCFLFNEFPSVEHLILNIHDDHSPFNSNEVSQRYLMNKYVIRMIHDLKSLKILYLSNLTNADNYYFPSLKELHVRCKQWKFDATNMMLLMQRVLSEKKVEKLYIEFLNLASDQLNISLEQIAFSLKNYDTFVKIKIEILSSRGEKVEKYTETNEWLKKWRVNDRREIIQLNPKSTDNRSVEIVFIFYTFNPHLVSP